MVVEKKKKKKLIFIEIGSLIEDYLTQ